MVSSSDIMVEVRRNGPFGVADFDVHQLFSAQTISSVAFRRAGLLKILPSVRQYQASGCLVAAYLDDRRLR